MSNDWLMDMLWKTDLRGRLSESQNHRCAYCCRSVREEGKKSGLMPTLEHIIPRSKGGKTNYENCVMACFTCNGSRSLNDPFEFYEKVKYRVSNARVG